jgi:hypothetical protein
MPRTIALTVLLLLLAGACAAGTEPEAERIVTLEVAHHTVPCTALIPRECLLIREQGSSEWGRFYDHIEGFTWERGYAYTIVVSITPIPNPPQDSSSVSYTLLQVIQRVAVEP